MSSMNSYERVMLCFEGKKPDRVPVFPMDRLEMLAATEVDGLSLDSKVDFSMAREKLGADYLLIGNVDPTDPLTLGTPELVYEHCKKVIEQAGSEGHFILSAGCLVPAEAPPRNLEAMIKAAREVVSY